MSEPIIQIQHLTKTFGSGEGAVHALDDINLEIRQGEIFGIIGLSGAGKSTLVRCMNLLERPTSGTVIVDGQSLAWTDETDGRQRFIGERELRLARRKITMIFQSFNLLMQRTCLKNVCFPMELGGVPAAQAKQRALELLELVGLVDKAGAYPAQLSGGQKQRVAIARALATDPKVLLCDEATSALDPTTTASILDLLKDLNQKLGVTVVVITHQMSVIEEICSQVAILDGGVVAEQGAVEEIFSHPTTDAARRLVYPGGASGRHPGRPGGLQRRNCLSAPDRVSRHRLRRKGQHSGRRHPQHRRQGLRHHAAGAARRSQRGRQGPELHPFPAQCDRRGGGVPWLRPSRPSGPNTATFC